MGSYGGVHRGPIEQRPFKSLTPGGPISAAETNRANRTVEALSRISGNGLTTGGDGPQLHPLSPTGFWAKLLEMGGEGSGSGAGADDCDSLGAPYSWHKLYHTKRAGTAIVTRHEDPFAGTTEYLPAFEVSGTPVDELPAIAWLERGEGDFYLFQCCCNVICGAGSGSGSG